MPASPRLTTSVARLSMIALSGICMAACGHNQDVSIQKASADTNALSAAAAVSSSTKDSGLSAGNRTLDSLRQAGVTPKNGLDSTGSKAQAITRNDPGHDTSHLNNRATPGAGPAAPAGTAPGAKRP